MQIIHVTDPADPRLVDYTNLTDVQLRSKDEPEKGMYIAESTTVIHRALAAGHRPRSFLMAEKWLPGLEEAISAVGLDDGPGGTGEPVPVYVGEPAVLEAITGFNLHRGALSAMHRPTLPSVHELLTSARDGQGARRVAILEDIVDHTNVCDSKTPRQEPARRSRIAILEGVNDHTNVGSAFRNAAAMGLDAVLVSPDCADPLYRRSVRVSMGTVFQVPWTRFEHWPSGLEVLKEHGYVIAGMTLGAGAITLDELVAEDHEKLAIVLGSEGHGISPKVDRLLDRRVTIPMMGGVDSLNVAAAAAVAFYATR